MEAFLTQYLDSLEVQRERLERALKRLTPPALWQRPRDGLNSIGNLCLHVAGNESHYLGRCVGGSAYVRDRPGEFRAEGGLTETQLIEKLREARETTRAVLARLSSADLDRPVEADHPPQPTVLRILLHVLEHYSYHTGQVIQLTRLLQEGDERLLEWGH